MKRVFLFLGLSFFLLMPSAAAIGTSNDPISLPFGHSAEGVSHLPNIEVTQKEAEKVGLSRTGLFLRKLLGVASSLLALGLRPIAVFLIFLAGYQLIAAQSAASEEIQKQKMNVFYILVGLILFGLSADIVFNYIYYDSGEFLLGRESSRLMAVATANRIKRLLDLFLSFSGAAAILMLVISGIRLVINPGNEDDIGKNKKMVGYVAAGIVIIGLADTMINQVVFPDGGYSGMNVAAFELQLKGLSNYILGFLGAVIFVTFVISGVLMVINQGDEDMWGKIKTTMKNVVLGTIISYSAYTVVATLLRTFLAAREGTPF